MLATDARTGTGRPRTGTGAHTTTQAFPSQPSGGEGGGGVDDA